MKKFIYIYLRAIAVILIIVGLSFSITSLNEIYGVIFSDNIIYQSSNLYLIFGGVLFPLFMFVIGIYIYFNVDYKPKNLKIIIFVFSLIFTIFGLFNIMNTFIEYHGIFKTLIQVSYFLNDYYKYITFVIGLGLIYGTLNYDYLTKIKKNHRRGVNKYGYRHLL